MLCREIIAVYTQIHTKPINTVCEHNGEFLDFKPCGTNTDRWALKS